MLIQDRVPYASLRRALFIGITASIVLFLGAGRSLSSQGKAADKELKAKIAELLKGLDASKATARQEAQEELIKLGPEIVPLLPAQDSDELSAEQRRRIIEIRKALGTVTGKASLSASKVTLSAKGITLSDAVAEIQRQTGNQIVDLRDEFGQPVTNPEFAAEWKDKGFWEAMDEMSQKTQVSYYLHTGERQLGLVMQPSAPRPTAYAGPLRITLDQIVRRIQYENSQKECVLQFEIAWEPRVRPILFEMKPDEVEVIDDLDRKIAAEADRDEPVPQGQPGNIKAAVDGSMIRTDFILKLAKPEKGAEKLKVVRGKMGVVLPADIQTFDFAELTKAKNVKKQKGNVTVVLEQFKALDEGLWAADVLLEFDAASEAFESYETWFYDNEAFLQKPDGTRFATNGGTTLTESGDGRVGIQYRFVDAPGKIGDYKLIYKTPSTIVRDSVSFEFKDIELP
jgi:hypothetical protein